MSDAAEQGTEDATRKGGKRGLILAGVLAIALAGGGFMAARTGLIPAFSPKTPESGLGDIAYRYGYQRFDVQMMVSVIVVLVALVMLVQATGDSLAQWVDKRQL